MSARPLPAVEPLDIAHVRADFPLLSREVNGKPLIYLDNANTPQKPKAVIEAVDRFYRSSNANVAPPRRHASHSAKAAVARCTTAVLIVIDALDEPSNA